MLRFRPFINHLKNISTSFWHLALTHWGIGIVLIVSLLIAFANVVPGTIYSGWDNIHAEFNLVEYTRQVVFGAWLEDGLGAPAGLAHLSEIPRLPILYILNVLLPSNLVRYSFIFLMFTLGGIGMYWYLSKIWLSEKSSLLRTILATIGALFYLLHVLTLQQFYISFELFTVQFGLLPFLLLSIHALARNISAHSLLCFIGLQLLIAPSGHTPTLYYIGALFSMIYAFSIVVKKQRVQKAIGFALGIGLISFVVNAYWILPNVYYSAHHSQNVQVSRENSLFSPESISSIKETYSYQNFLKGTQYLFSWKDYSFATKKHEFIFQEWSDYFSIPLIQFCLENIGRMTLLGFLVLLFWGQKGNKRFAVASVYLICVVMIWINSSSLKSLVDYFFQNETFLEAFRNPFTKLSILYSFLSVLLIVTFIEKIVYVLKKIPDSFSRKLLIVTFLLLALATLLLTALPSFRGNFINEKLRIIYPDAYQELFTYLQSKPRDLRLLQLPQQAAVGWEYYDWSFLKPGNGYQGMGFLFAGIPQPVLNRESDRWSIYSDTFYYQLEFALDNQNYEIFEQLCSKYNIGLILIDETKIEPGKNHDYQLDHSLARKAGFNLIWHRDFLSLYEKGQTINAESPLFSPKSTLATNGNSDGITTDNIYKNEGAYVSATSDGKILYPFSYLSERKLFQPTITEDSVVLTATVPSSKYKLTIPSSGSAKYFTPVFISLNDKKIQIIFPNNSISLGETILEIPKLADFDIVLDSKVDALYVFFNDTGVLVNHGKPSYSVIGLDSTKPIRMNYSPNTEYYQSHQDNAADPNLVELPTISPDWEAIQSQIELDSVEISNLAIKSVFPLFQVDLTAIDSNNCSTPNLGQISTKFQLIGSRYSANDFGVNCNGYENEYFSSNFPMLFHIEGSNIKGRGLKLFIKHNGLNTSTQQYLFKDKSFNNNILIQPVFTTAEMRPEFHLDWETRSFGNENITELLKIQAFPLPVQLLSRIKLTPSIGIKHWNQLAVSDYRRFLDSIYQVDLNCEVSPCVLGLDQAYDSLWIAFSLSELRVLPHLVLNDWANGWEILESGSIIIIYIPELLSLTSFLLLIVIIIFLTKKIIIHAHTIREVSSEKQYRFSSIKKKANQLFYPDK